MQQPYRWRSTGSPSPPPPQIAGADDDRHLDAEIHDPFDVARHRLGAQWVDAEALRAGQGLTSQLEQNATVGGLVSGELRVHAAFPPMKPIGPTQMVGPTHSIHFFSDAPTLKSPDADVLAGLGDHLLQDF